MGINKFLKYFKLTAEQCGYREVVDYDDIFFRDSSNYNTVEMTRNIRTEKMYNIRMPESVIQELTTITQEVFGPNINEHDRKLFRTMIHQKEEERRIRAQYPAVQQAYENYSLLLSMCKTKED